MTFTVDIQLKCGRQVPLPMHTLQEVTGPVTILGTLLKRYSLFISEESLSELYYRMVVDLAVLYGAKQSYAEVEMKKAVLFEKKLLQVIDMTRSVHISYDNISCNLVSLVGRR